MKNYSLQFMLKISQYFRQVSQVEARLYSLRRQKESNHLFPANQQKQASKSIYKLCMKSEQQFYGLFQFMSLRGNEYRVT